ncbi:MAG: hypothetical protein MAG451_02301 [Anaerolineales bacterium]|nr:hypothetical protein [Anaerolineales bacterium]
MIRLVPNLPHPNAGSRRPAFVPGQRPAGHVTLNGLAYETRPVVIQIDRFVRLWRISPIGENRFVEVGRRRGGGCQAGKLCLGKCTLTDPRSRHPGQAAGGIGSRRSIEDCIDFQAGCNITVHNVVLPGIIKAGTAFDFVPADLVPRPAGAGFHRALISLVEHLIRRFQRHQVDVAHPQPIVGFGLRDRRENRNKAPGQTAEQDDEDAHQPYANCNSRNSQKNTPPSTHRFPSEVVSGLHELDF